MLAARSSRFATAQSGPVRRAVAVRAFKPVRTEDLVATLTAGSLLLVRWVLGGDVAEICYTCSDCCASVLGHKCVLLCCWSVYSLDLIFAPVCSKEGHKHHCGADFGGSCDPPLGWLRACSRPAHNQPVTVVVVFVSQATPAFASLPEGYASPQGSDTAAVEAKLDALIEQRTGKAEALPELTEVPAEVGSCALCLVIEQGTAS